MATLNWKTEGAQKAVTHTHTFEAAGTRGRRNCHRLVLLDIPLPSLSKKKKSLNRWVDLSDPDLNRFFPFSESSSSSTYFDCLKRNPFKR